MLNIRKRIISDLLLSNSYLKYNNFNAFDNMIQNLKEYYNKQTEETTFRDYFKLFILVNDLGFDSNLYFSDKKFLDRYSETLYRFYMYRFGHDYSLTMNGFKVFTTKELEKCIDIILSSEQFSTFIIYCCNMRGYATPNFFNDILEDDFTLHELTTDEISSLGIENLFTLMFSGMINGNNCQIRDSVISTFIFVLNILFPNSYIFDFDFCNTCLYNHSNDDYLFSIYLLKHTIIYSDDKYVKNVCDNGILDEFVNDYKLIRSMFSNEDTRDKYFEKFGKLLKKKRIVEKEFNDKTIRKLVCDNVYDFRNIEKDEDNPIKLSDNEIRSSIFCYHLRKVFPVLYARDKKNKLRFRDYEILEIVMDSYINRDKTDRIRKADYVYIPLTNMGHFTLLKYSKAKHHFYYFNSLGGISSSYNYYNLKKYFNSIRTDEKKFSIDDKIDSCCTLLSSHTQPDGYSCGHYTLYNLINDLIGHKDNEYPKTLKTFYDQPEWDKMFRDNIRFDILHIAYVITYITFSKINRKFETVENIPYYLKEYFINRNRNDITKVYSMYDIEMNKTKEAKSESKKTNNKQSYTTHSYINSIINNKKDDRKQRIADEEELINNTMIANKPITRTEVIKILRNKGLLKYITK